MDKITKAVISATKSVERIDVAINGSSGCDKLVVEGIRLKTAEILYHLAAIEQIISYQVELHDTKGG